MTTLGMFIRSPDAIVVGLNVGYTVPAGKVAKVKATLSVSNTGYVSADTLNSTNVYSPTGSSSAQSSTLDMVLPAGTIVNSTRTTNTGTTSGGPAAQLERVTDAICTMTINGSNANTVRASASISTPQFGTGSGTVSLTTTGVADFGFIAEEYLY